jgi:hypothetical protein
MAMQIYNHTAKLFANSQVTLAALKAMLVGASYTFDATETAMTTAQAQEVSGNGWAAGGEAIASAAVTQVTTNDAMLDGDDISKTATGGAIGPASGVVVYDSTGAGYSTRRPLFYYAFPSAKTADSGTPFVITWHANGIARWTVT